MVTGAPMPGISTPPWPWPMQVSSSPPSRITAIAGATRATPPRSGNGRANSSWSRIICWTHGVTMGVSMRRASARSASRPAVSRCSRWPVASRTCGLSGITAGRIPLFEDCQIVERHPLPLDAAIVWAHDPRIKAVVSAAPALGFAFGRTGPGGGPSAGPALAGRGRPGPATSLLCGGRPPRFADVARGACRGECRALRFFDAMLRATGNTRAGDLHQQAGVRPRCIS